MPLKKMSEFSDREIALLMGALYGDEGKGGKRDALIAEAAYRLVRANLGGLSGEEAEVIDQIHTCDFRLRNAERQQRQINASKTPRRKGNREFGGQKVVPIAR